MKYSLIKHEGWGRFQVGTPVLACCFVLLGLNGSADLAMLVNKRTHDKMQLYPHLEQQQNLHWFSRARILSSVSRKRNIFHTKVMLWGGSLCFKRRRIFSLLFRKVLQILTTWVSRTRASRAPKSA